MHPHHHVPAQSTAFGFLTFSDTRTEENDVGGKLLRQIAEAAGHTVAVSRIVREDQDAMRAALCELLERPDVQVIVTTGGTGISLRDLAFETVTSLLSKRLDGFGELFRMLSYEQVGAAAMFSRAVAGLTIQGKFIFAVPGSPKAVQLAMDKLIVPQVSHLLSELQKHN